jgi:hydroxymethylbilane synthase
MVNQTIESRVADAPARTLRLGTRGSALAIWQTERVIELLRNRHPDLHCDVKIISTQGDRDKETPLSIIGGQGVFIKELESAILSGEVDCAVHSLKDMPSDLPDNLVLEAVLERHDPRDVLVSRHAGGLAGLPDGARVGTSSRRRIVQLQNARPDLVPVELRGNIDTRIAKALDEDGDYDAAILASAGLLRMKRDDAISEFLDPAMFTPAPGQAALTIECRDDDMNTRAILASIHDSDVALQVEVERAFLRGIGGGCRSPIGALASAHGTRVHLLAMVASEDLTRTEKVDLMLDSESAIDDAESIAGDMLGKLTP